MTNPLRSAAIHATTTALAAEPGHRLEHYAVVLANGALYKWRPGTVEATSGDAIVGHTGGYAGTWIQVPGRPLGTELTNADETVTVGGGLVRTMATLTVNRVKTLSTTGAVSGHLLTVVTDSAAFTCAFVNGGVGAGTLVTKPSGQAWTYDFIFDGTDWVLIRKAQLA